MLTIILILTILNFLLLSLIYVIFGYFVVKKLRSKKVSTFSTPIKNHAYKKNSSRKL